MIVDYPDSLIRKILAETKTIAMVGASQDWVRPSNFAMKYLQQKGYKVVPINPGKAESIINGELCYSELREAPGQIDMVDIFRRSTAAGKIVDQVIEQKNDKAIKTIWMQLGVVDLAAAKKAQKAGLTVIMDRCPKIEFGRLNYELSWCGINSGIISSKRPRLN